MKTILQETTTEVAGLSTRKHQYWFDEAGKEIPELLGKMSFCHNRLLAKPDDEAACDTLQAKLRTTQNDWWTALLRGHNAMLIYDMCTFCEALKAVHGPSHQIEALYV